MSQTKRPFIGLFVAFACTFVLVISLVISILYHLNKSQANLSDLKKTESLRIALVESYIDMSSLLRLQILNNKHNYQPQFVALQNHLNILMDQTETYTRHHKLNFLYSKLTSIQNKLLSIQKKSFVSATNNKTNYAEDLINNSYYHQLEINYIDAISEILNRNNAYQYWVVLCNNLLLYYTYQNNILTLLTDHFSDHKYLYYSYQNHILRMFSEALNTSNPQINHKIFKSAHQNYLNILKKNKTIMDLLNANKTSQAKKIILSEQYLSLNNQYKIYINRAIASLQSSINNQINSTHHNQELLIFILIAVIFLFICLWIFILIILQKWRKSIERINAHLERKVKHRTKKLLEEIEAHQKAELEKSKLETILRQTQKLHSIGILAAGIAHDFNNLLAIIFANAESLELDNPDNQDSLDSLLEAATEASQLTKQLLTFARKSPQQKSSQNINDLIMKTISLLEPSLPHNVTITYQLTDLPLIANIDPTQITQVLLNIGINAKDAMPDGGTITFLSAAKKVNIDNSGEHQYATINIIDTGTGIAEEDIEYIFDPFFTKKDVNKGTGLGLSTAYGIIKQHAGNITVQSDNEGTAFTIYIPLEDQS